MTSRSCLTVALSLACLAVPPVAGGATEERPAPDSPAGNEYKLPLERAREQSGSAPSDPQQDGSDGSDAPLFGVGIAPAPRQSRPGDPEGSRKRPGDAGENGAPRADRPDRGAGDVAAAEVGGEGVSSSLVALVVVLPLLGGALGLLARRRLLP